MTEFQNSSISKENFSITNSGRNTLPLIQFTQPVQRQGSIMLDPRTNIPYYSDGISWIPFSTGTITNDCIHDADMTTSVCTDTDPPTGSETIYFTTDGTLRAIFDPDGVFIATAGAVDPTTIIPAAGKVAHFEGDIDVTGVVDPTGVQFTQQLVSPTATNIPNLGTLYVNSAPLGPFNNTLVFVDNADVSHTLGTMIGPAPFVTDNSITRFDGTSGSLIQESPLTLGDTGIIANPTGDIGLDPNGGTGTVNVTGDLSVTGIIEDPIGVQFTPQAVPPVGTNVIYIDTAPLGPFSNTLVFVDSASTAHTLGTMIGPGPLVTDNSITRFDGTSGNLVQESPLTLGDTGIIANPTGNIGLDANGGLGTVNISGNLNVMGTTTSIDTQTLLVQDNTIYLNNGYTVPMGLSGCVTVNYLPTINSALVAGAGFTAGVAAVSNPTVVTDGSFAWSVGDIIQVSGANDVANDGLFEVNSYAAPILTIRGIGLVPTSFTFFQNQFTTDAIVAGTITQVNVANICSGTNGNWEVSTAPSNDNTTGMTFVPISVGFGDCVTVGTIPSADYPTIFDAYTAGHNNVCVITNVSETMPVDLSSGATHFCINLNPGVNVSNTIAAAAPWFTGASTLLKIKGAGAHMDLTTAGLSSQITLQLNQTFRSGVDAELDIEGVRFTGSGTNVLLSASSRISKCRFDGATLFDLSSFDRNLFVDNCLFTVPVQLDSLVGAAEKSAIISNNLFDNGANITIPAVNNLVFNGNTIGKTAATSMTISGATCDNVVISNNNFVIGELTISSTNLTDTNISDNVWSRDTVDGLTISSICNNIIVSNNVLHHILFGAGTVTASIIDGNTTANNISSSASTTDTKITNNCIGLNLVMGVLSSAVISNNVIAGALSATISTDSSVTGNHLTTMTFTGTVTDGVIDGNEASGAVTFAAFTTSTCTANTFTGVTTFGACTSSTYSGNTTAAAVTFASLTTCTLSGNVFTVAVTTVTGAVANSVISTNTLFQLTCSLTVTSSDIVGNVLTRAGAVAVLTITGACTNVNVCNNNGGGVWSFGGAAAAILDCNFNDNRRTGVGSLTFAGTFTDSNFSGNTIELVTTFSLAVSNSNMSNNSLVTLTFSSTITNSNIVGNIITTLSIIVGACSRTNLNGNTGGGTWTIGAVGVGFSFGTFNNNVVTNGVGTGVVTFGGTFADSTMVGNTVNLAMTITGNVSNSNISANTCDNMVFSGTLINSDITGNDMISAAGTSLSIVGNCDKVNVSSNTLESPANISANFINGVFSNNIVDAAVTFGIIGSLFTGNTVEGNQSTGIMTITGAVTDTKVSDNTVDRLIFSSSITDGIIQGNLFTNGGAATSFSTGVCNRVNINNNLGLGNWTIGSFTGGSFDNNTLRTGVGTGNLTFTASVDTSSISHNVIIGILTLTLAVTDTNIINNSVDRLLLSLSVTNSTFQGNLFTNSGAATTFSIVGTCFRVNVNNNSGRGNWSVADFDRGTFNNNVLRAGVGTGNLTFTSIVDKTLFIDNSIAGLVTITGAVTQSNINNNNLDRLALPLSITESNIQGNLFVNDGSATSFSIGTCLRVNINNNTGLGDWNVAAFTASIFSNNLLRGGVGLGDLTFTSTLSRSSIIGNEAAGILNLTMFATESSISNNRCGGGIVIDSAGSTGSTGLTVNGNNCEVASIRFGDGVGAGSISNSTINNNIARGGITATTATPVGPPNNTLIGNVIFPGIISATFVNDAATTGFNG